MQCQVELAAPGQTQQQIAHYLRFGLREGRGALVGVSAGVARGTHLSPVEIEVAIGIGAVAGAAHRSASLAPHARRGVRVLIAIGIDHRQDDPVVILQQLSVGDKVLGQLVDDVQSSSGCDPFTCMNTSIQEDDILARLAIAIGNGNGLQVATLIGLAYSLDSDAAGIRLSQLIEVGIDLGMTLEGGEADATGGGTLGHGPSTVLLLLQTGTQILFDDGILNTIPLQHLLEVSLILGLHHNTRGRIHSAWQIEEVVVHIVGQAQHQLLLEVRAGMDVVDFVAVREEQGINVKLPAITGG